MTNKWQPIETAPSNVDVLMFCPNLCEANKERVEVGVYHNTKAGSLKQWATHWMPIPEPPKVKMNRVENKPPCYDRESFEFRGKHWQGCSQTDEDLYLTPGCSGCRNLNKEPEEVSL